METPSHIPFDQPDTYVNQDSVTAVGVLFPLLTIGLMVLQASRWRHSNFQLDDFFIIPAAVSAPAFIV